ncbi:glycosyltransferase family 2 protein [Roseobacter sinensis]|uniref:Glycosyltransferase family 2 protein n=1 Tax=Roseobacter sinensis TaxID=2931391 RepID=A0ABT3BFS0_9RHOB|nr:glycosyltransferase family 2 protein [Roseobacter sp. WL0113]MCV3272412.1 glycosyltransferase family 2 protein [Roseobacter sp. WL0113]
MADAAPKITAVLTVRNEAAFLLEWFAHHHAAGVSDFVVCSNDCADGTDAMLDRLEQIGWLAHLRNAGPYGNRGIQFTALKLADEQPLVKDADWLVPLDIDEFVTVKTGDNTLPALIAALPDATAITLTWRLFGNAGVTHYCDQLVTDQFTRCAPEVIFWPWRAVMFKTLYRNDGTYGKLGVHRPKAPNRDRLDGAQWRDGEGRSLGAPFKTRRVFSDYGQPNYGLVQLNHYPLGAMESFVLKADRGRAVHADVPLAMDYWVERNFNTDEDTSIAALKPRRDAMLAELKADQTLARLHTEAVAWRKARFETLMQQEPMRALFARLLMTPPSEPISPEAAKDLTRYALQDRQNPNN